MLRVKRADLFDGYSREREFDPKWLSELVSGAKGDRSLAAFAEDCQLNISSLSRIINMKNNGPSSDEVLARIALNAAPESGVTIDELLMAVGKERNEGAPCAEETLRRLNASGKLGSLETEENDPSSVVPVGSGTLTALDHVVNRNSHSTPTTRFRQPVLDALIMLNCDVALEKDLIAIKDVKSEHEALFKFKTNALKDEGLEKWAFIELKKRGISACTDVKLCFGEMFVHNPVLDGTRVTMLLEDKTTYDILVEHYKSVKIPASFSLMLVDTKDRRVVSEYVFARSDGIEPVRLFSAS